MEWVALALFAVYFSVAFVYRTIVQIKRTGDSGFRGLSGRVGSVEWWAGVLFAAALVVAVGAPVAGLVGLPVIAFLEHGWLASAGVLLAVCGIAATLASQLSMGGSWRVGVDPFEKIELVTQGAFSLVRNPIFSAMIATGAGLAMIVPNIIGVTGLVMLWVAIELQVRRVEEPYLAKIHTVEWQDYRRRVGRFWPHLG